MASTNSGDERRGERYTKITMRPIPRSVRRRVLKEVQDRLRSIEGEPGIGPMPVTLDKFNGRKNGFPEIGTQWSINVDLPNLDEDDALMVAALVQGGLPPEMVNFRASFGKIDIFVKDYA